MSFNTNDLMELETQYLLEMLLHRQKVLSKLTPDERIKQEQVYALQDIASAIESSSRRLSRPRLFGLF